MSPLSTKRGRKDDASVRRPKKVRKVFKKQKHYHSSSEDEDEEDGEFAPINMAESDDDEAVGADTNLVTSIVSQPGEDVRNGTAGTEELKASEDMSEDEHEEAGGEDDDSVEDLNDLEVDDDPSGSEVQSDADEDEDQDEDGDESVTAGADRKKRKRNDPTAFATSMSKILSSKLSKSKAADPVLSRSATATQASRELTDARLEAKAKRKMHAERKAALEKGRVRDVLGLDSADVSTAHIQEQEKRLKKTAQRGVVKLFNAVRAAQIQADKAREEARKEGVVGLAQREERISEMSKKGFLDLIAQGGKKTAT